MSALAGIFRFDPRDRVNMSNLMDLAQGIDRIGPDGGSEHLAANVGMAYRAFHTTPESHFEVQPLVRRGCVLTWDGRLDNRDEIRARINGRYDGTPTDVDLVFAAYEEWGTGCFAELIGDWALALWDEAKQQLTLARDYIGVRRLFYRVDEGGIAWCTTIEPLVLTSGRKLHLDLDYLAGCLYPRPPVEATPYLEIRSVVPASFLTFGLGGKRAARQYWCLNPHAQIRYSTDRDYEEHFREVFRESVNRRLRSDRTILAELSGGIDSTSIVCMADDIRASHPGYAIETLSYYDTDEPSGDERPYFELVEQKRGYPGHQISIAEFRQQTLHDSLMPLPEGCFAACPGYFTRHLHWFSIIEEIQNQTGSRVILSGLGGDEVLGGIQYEAPELADHLVAGRLTLFVRSVLRWSLARKKTAYALLGDMLRLLWASYRPVSLHGPSVRQPIWVSLKPVTRHPALKTFAHWHGRSPVHLLMESVRYSLAQQLTCTDPPLTGCAEQRYPFLDRSLFVFLASIPRTQVLQAGHRRHLIRRALLGMVPREVLSRKTKWFGFRSTLAVFRGQENTINVLFQDPWLSDQLVVDTALVRKQIELVQDGASNEGLLLSTAIGIEHWLRSQLRRGSLVLTAQDPSARTPMRQAEVNS
jgi:asparagine synthase (glutamine-hydrolysing)